MTKLTDTQLIVLSSAAKHDGGLATRPIKLHAAAASKVATSLVNKGLVREIRAKMDAPVWREDGEGRYSLKITRAGRDAINVDQGDAEDEAPHPQNAAEAGSKKRSGKPTDAKAAPRRGIAVRRRAAPQSAANCDDSSSTALRSGSKQAAIVGLMMRPRGATLAELIGLTDWLPHTTRAALTGLRKRGYLIEPTRGDDKVTRYRAERTNTDSKAANVESAALETA